MNKGTFKLLGIVFIILVLAGCGGGGSGGSSSESIDNNTEEDTSLYQGAKTPVQINLSNAETLTRVLLSGSNSSASDAVQAQTLSKPLPAAIQKQINNRSIRYTSMTNIEGETNTYSSQSTTETIQGLNSGTLYVEDLSNGEVTGTVILTYTNFNDDDGETINGKMTMEVISYDSTFDFPTDSKIFYENFRISSDTIDETVTGEIRIKFNTQTGSQTVSVNFDTKDNNTAESLRFENLVSIISPYTQDEEGNLLFTESYSGRIYISTLGYFDVSTQSPLFCSRCDNSEYLPGGSLFLSGENNSSILISVINTEQLQAQIDEDGDEYYESTLILNFSNIGL